MDEDGHEYLAQFGGMGFTLFCIIIVRGDEPGIDLQNVTSLQILYLGLLGFFFPTSFENIQVLFDLFYSMEV